MNAVAPLAPRATLLLCLALGLGCSAWQEPQPPLPYTEEQIVENVVTYVAVVFGDREPTIAQYYQAEGPAPGLERDLELAQCSRELGLTLQSQRIRAAPGCVDWYSQRRRNAEMEPSLFYAALREKADLDPARTQIESIRPPRGSDEYYVVVVRDVATRTRLEIYHAPRPEMAEISRLGVQRINGELVIELLGEQFEGFE